jgi:hypothetical protein
MYISDDFIVMRVRVSPFIVGGRFGRTFDLSDNTQSVFSNIYFDFSLWSRKSSE